MRLVLGFGISAVLVFLLIRTIDPTGLSDALSAVDWRVIPIAVALYFVGVWVRSVRWGYLLPEHSVSTGTLFRALVVGFTVNNLLPIRMGDVARAYLLARWCRVPYGATLASLVVERVLDGLTLALVLLVALAFVPSAPGYLLVPGVLVAAAFFAGALLVALAAWRSSLIIHGAQWLGRFLPERAGGLLVRLAVSFARSLALVGGRARLDRLVALSVLAWVSELSLFYVVMLGFSATFPVSVALAFLAGSAGNFATLVPSSPGYVGTFDGALVKVLQDTAHIASGPAAAYALVVHATLLLPVVVVGLAVLWRSHTSLGQITHAAEAAPSSRAEGDWPAAA